MSQETIEVNLTTNESDADVLEFYFEENPINSLVLFKSFSA